MSKNQFDWIAFYEEFADKLLAYKDNRQELIEKIKQVYEVTGIKLPTLERNENGDNEIVDIDPFTVFGLFNKRMSNDNRIKLISAIKSTFQISAFVPGSFDGIPMLDPRNSTFYYFIYSKKEENIRKKSDIPNLWTVFEYALYLSNNDNNKNREKFSVSFNKALQQKGINWTLSIGLFWIRPNRFINLDSRNRGFIKNSDSLPESITTAVNNLRVMPKAEVYLKICDDCIEYIQSDKCSYKSLADFSCSAWSVSKQDDEVEKRVKTNNPIKVKSLRWFNPLLQALRDLGGSATPQQVRERIKINEHLTEEETSVVTGKSKVNQFENEVAFARMYLVKSGYMDGSVYGIWALTDEGKSVQMTEELASEIFRKVVKDAQEKRDAKVTNLVDEDATTKRYWIYSPGHNAAKWEECTQNDVMLIGWGEIGDLSNYTSKAEMKATMQDTYGDNKSYRNAAHATWQFAYEMKPGDIVFAKQGMHKIIGRGVVDSDYNFKDNADDGYNNVRAVKWTNIGEWEHPGQAAMKTLTDITQYTKYVEELNALFDTDEDDDDIPEVETTLDNYDKEDFLKDVYISAESYTTLVGLMTRKRNVILLGAPGVGKTFAAKRLAYSMMGVMDSSRVQSVQFHQSYTYEDFIEGFRPSVTGTGFEIKKGVFYNFCMKAENDSENDYFFIIDEINRGNLSKIFGELFTLIEADKRGKRKMELLYSSDNFSVPKNVYIIGMMNTADRSLAMIDYALRRRFAFYEMKPAFESEGFREYQYGLENDKFNKLIDCVISLNQKIADDDSLGEGFCIGHSYFCDIEEIKENTLTDIVEFEIIPLLKEYWFDEPSKVKEWSERLRSAVK